MLSPDWMDLLKLLAAVGAGAIIGLERELHGKTAGFRTNILICLGAALFTVISERVAATSAVADPGRIAAQVVTGVGFLGAGAIIHLQRSVTGLTTAATIWVVASVGMAFGAGEFVLGAVGLVLTAVSLAVLSYIEGLVVVHWRDVLRFEAQLEAEGDPAEILERLAHEHGVRCQSLRFNKHQDRIVARGKVVGPKPALERFARDLLREPSVTELRR